MLTENDREWQIKPALFLDLDGTIRRSKYGDFIKRPEDIELFPDVEERLHEYKSRGFMLFGISNQGGIAYGFKTKNDVLAEIEQTLRLFKVNPFDEDTIFYEPTHPDGKVAPYNIRSLIRKPGYGLLVVCEIRARKERIMLDLNRSILVGDMAEDALCAEAAGIKFVHANDFFGRK